jgi:tetratricopeptide (TPR) repeat protein
MRIKQLSLLAACAGGLALAGCAPMSSSGGLDPEFAGYINSRAPRAQQAEQEADQALARGDVAAAIDGYTRAVGDTLVGTKGLAGASMERDESRGWVVERVDAGGPADLAGLKAGDVVVPISPHLAPFYAGWAHNAIGLSMDDPLRPVQVSVRRGAAAPQPMTLERTPTLRDEPTTQEQAVGTRAFKKLVAAYATLAPRPPVPARARALARDAQAKVGAATTAEAVDAISQQYRLAAYVAPWWSDLYINYALFQEAYDDPAGAIESLDNYLQLNPQAADAPQVRAKIASLQGPAAQERELAAWEGSWFLMWNGTRQTYGMWVHRKGRELFVRYDDKVPYLRGTISGDAVAKVENRFSDDAGSVSDEMKDAVRRCFGGAMEIPGTLRLAPNRQQLTLTMEHDFNFDVTNCRFDSSAPSTMVYVR